MNYSFFFPHKCTVKRATGEFDSEFKEVFSVVYEGECGYQPSNNAYNASGMAILNSPNVILPVNSEIFKADDLVVVTVEKGRVIEAKVENFEDLEDSDVGGTTLWLRMGEDSNG